jgi:hypothetical protein
MSEQDENQSVFAAGTLLFFQIAIILGLITQLALFFVFLWLTYPMITGNAALLIQFFTTVAIWVLTIDAGIWLFWWVAKNGRLEWTLYKPLRMKAEPDQPEPKKEAHTI